MGLLLLDPWHLPCRHSLSRSVERTLTEGGWLMKTRRTSRRSGFKLLLEVLVFVGVLLSAV